MYVVFICIDFFIYNSDYSDYLIEYRSIVISVINGKIKLLFANYYLCVILQIIN